MKYKIAAFWSVAFCALFAFLHFIFRYHFFYIEQSQFFQSTWSYWTGKVSLPGGLASWLSEWLLQFYIVPYAGPAITAGLLVSAGLITDIIIRRIAPRNELFLLPLLPLMLLMFIHFDFNYLLSGTIAFVFLLLFLLFYLFIGTDTYRFLAGWVLTPVLYWLAGPVCVMFAILVAIYELMSRTPKRYLALLPCVEVILIGLGCVSFSLTGEYRFAFLPDAYYHKGLEPKAVIYFSWGSLLLVFITAFWVKRWRSQQKLKRRVGESLLQLFLLGGLLYWGFPKYSDVKSIKLKELDYYVRMERWDDIIGMCRGKLTNYLYLCYLNKALAEKGELADRMFAFDQRGPQGLIVAWNKAEQCSTILSEIYFTMGHVSQSRQMAFEGFVGSIGGGSPRLLQRLVQTNLIFGAYPVAEKYIGLLENTFYYKEWATAHRKFLYRDAVVEADPVLGPRRKSLPSKNNLAQIYGLEEDLKRMAETNPTYKASIEYVGAFYLLTKNLDGFKNMIETYYGTDVLPVLPVSFQEAVITLSEKETDYWKRFNISESVLQRFTEYKRTVLANKNNSSALPGLLYRSYGNTYWFYFMFK